MMSNKEKSRTEVQHARWWQWSFAVRRSSLREAAEPFQTEQGRSLCRSSGSTFLPMRYGEKASGFGKTLFRIEPSMCPPAPDTTTAVLESFNSQNMALVVYRLKNSCASLGAEIESFTANRNHFKKELEKIMSVFISQRQVPAKSASQTDFLNKLHDGTMLPLPVVDWDTFSHVLCSVLFYCKAKRGMEERNSFISSTTLTQQKHHSETDCLQTASDNGSRRGAPQVPTERDAYNLACMGKGVHSRWLKETFTTMTGTDAGTSFSEVVCRGQQGAGE